MRIRRPGGSCAGPARRLRLTGRFLLAATALAVVGGASAYAHWTTPGTGTSSASTGTLATVSIDGVSFNGSLRPAGPPADVTITVTNTNSFDVSIVSVTAGAITSDKPGCGGTGQPTGVSLDLSAVTGLVPALTTNLYTASSSMDTTSVSACQGATFTTPLTLLVRQ